MEEHLSRLDELVLNAIAYSLGVGMNCWEVEQKTGISRACSSARLNSLRNKNLIFDSKIRRPTDTGRNAVVYMKKILPDIDKADYSGDLFQ